jgi:hypothetical protein
MFTQFRKLVILTAIIAILGVVYYFSILSPLDLNWDKSSNKLVVYTEVGVREIDYYYIPDFRLWGDGHALWVRHSPDGKREVLTSKLSEQDIHNILINLKDAGFFKTRISFQREENSCSYQGVDSTLNV